MHHILGGFCPPLFLCFIALFQPVNCLIHTFVRERKSSAFFLFVRGLLKAPRFRIYPYCKCSTALSIIPVHKISHAVMAAGEWFLFNPPYGTSLLSIIIYRLSFLVISDSVIPGPELYSDSASPGLLSVSVYYITELRLLQTVSSRDHHMVRVLPVPRRSQGYPGEDQSCSAQRSGCFSMCPARNSALRL